MRTSLDQLFASLASIAGWGLTACLLMLASWLVAKWLGRVGRPDVGAYEGGDWPAIPEEMIAAAGTNGLAAGGRAEPHSQPPLTQTHTHTGPISHLGTGAS